jgi:O-antigen ligase
MFFPTRDSVGAAHYLFGGKNALAILIVPTMFYIAYYSRVVYHRLTFKNILLIAISVLTLFMGDSSTAVVIAIIALLSVLFIHRVRLGHYFYLTVFTIFQFFIISAQRLSEIPLVADFITNYLGKDLTFSGRSNVWEVTMNAINSSFFGYGRGNSVVSSQIIGLSESHNMILEILLTGGVILLILFIVVVVTAFGFQKTKANVDLYRLSAFFVFLYFILGLTESVPFKIDLWIMLAVIVSTNSILSNRLRDAKV